MEEKKGHAKITIEVEINEPLKDIVKESMAKMPEMAKMFRREKKKDKRCSFLFPYLFTSFLPCEHCRF